MPLKMFCVSVAQCRRSGQPPVKTISGCRTRLQVQDQGSHANTTILCLFNLLLLLPLVLPLVLLLRLGCTGLSVTQPAAADAPTIGNKGPVGLSPDGSRVLWDQTTLKAKPTAFTFSPTAQQLSVGTAL